MCNSLIVAWQYPSAYFIFRITWSITHRNIRRFSPGCHSTYINMKVNKIPAPHHTSRPVRQTLTTKFPHPLHNNQANTDTPFARNEILLSWGFANRSLASSILTTPPSSVVKIFAPALLGSGAIFWHFYTTVARSPYSRFYQRVAADEVYFRDTHKVATSQPGLQSQK